MNKYNIKCTELILVLKAIKIRIYPSDEQKDFIARQFGCCRVIYNSLLSFNTKYYEENKVGVSSEQVNQFLQNLKNENLWLRDVHSKVLQQSQRDLNQAFQNFFRRVKKGEKPGYPKFKSKKDNKLSCRFPKDAISSIKGNRISLIKKLSNILFKCSRRDEKYINKHFNDIHSITLSKTNTNKYFLSILVDYQPVRKSLVRNLVGIDLGIKDFAVTSEGEVINNQHFLKSELQNIKHLQRLHTKKEKGSKNREKARIRLAKAHERITNKKQNFLQQVSSRLINENQIICLEDLNIKGMVKNHTLAQSIQDVSWNEFVRMLEYKAQMYDRQIIKVNRFYPSSKTCNSCGYIYKQLKLSERQWTCPQCRSLIDRDYNAACNIKQEGLRILNKIE